MALETTSSVGILLADPRGRILYEQNPDVPFIPASTLKVLTALTALWHLGPDFHFKTDVFLDTHQNIKIRGGGDPLLTSREIHTLAMGIGEVLKQKNRLRIHGLVVDASAFEQRITIPGTTRTTNPYDAPVGALCANFNTISFKTRHPGIPTPFPKDLISAEAETPLIPFALEIIAASAHGMTEGRIPLPQGTQARYTGHLLEWFLEKEGILISKGVTTGRVMAGDRLIFTWHSPHDLQQVVQKMLCYSNNFMANQLFLTLGHTQGGSPGSLAKGAAVVMAQAATLGMEGVFIEEGSGISRGNRISPRAMLKLLQAFKPYHPLMKYSDHEYYKTGTLQGVRTRCGYFKGREGCLYPFVIMVNQEGKNYDNIKKRLQAKVAAWDATL